MKEILTMLHPDSPVRRYLKWIWGSGNHDLFKEKYDRIVKAQAHDTVFLTVVIRTQCRRYEMLQDVLTCLQGQSDQDFEIILVCHRAEEENYRKIAEMVKALPDYFARKIRIIRTEEGKRGAPANLGFAYARGHYAVCLDDDDLVLDHWVQAFHQAAETHDGMILHAYVLTQPWKVLQSREDGRQRLTAAGSPDGQYCVPYDTLAQVYENRCPFMGMAFPLYLFRDLHVLLDETLSTTEDWDYHLRTAGIAGVYDIEETTAIYRNWNTEDTSHKVAGFDEWEDNYRSIAEGNMPYPILLNGEEAEQCKRDLVGKQASSKKGRSCFMKDAVLFWSDDEPFSDERHMRAPVILKEDWMQVDFHVEERIGARPACSVRIDPADETLFCLENILMVIHDRKGAVQKYTLEDVQETNAIIEDDHALFLSEDPRMVFALKERTDIVKVGFRARVSYDSPAKMARWVEIQALRGSWKDDEPDEGSESMSDDTQMIRNDRTGKNLIRRILDILHVG